MKKCTKCDLVQILSSFGKNRKAPDGLTYWCKSCTKNQRMLRKQKDPEGVKTYARLWRREAKKENPELFTRKSKTYYRNNQDKVLAASKRWRDEHPEETRVYKQKWRTQNKTVEFNTHLVYSYGITLDKYNQMVWDQDNLCAICANPPPTAPYNRTKLRVDHIQVSGKMVVRGLLCDECNTALGEFRDSIHYLLRAIMYVGSPPMDLPYTNKNLVKYKKECSQGKHQCFTCTTRENLCIDHNHSSNQIRGILCRHCNKALGKFRESPTIIRAAIEYLKKHQVK